MELKISGVSDKRAPYFGMAFRSGKGEQFDASPYCYAVPNAGKGFFAGASFNQRIRAFIEKEIENTSYATLSFSYDSNKFDEELSISGFKVEAKIVSLGAEEILEPVAVGRKSAAVIESISINKVQWNRNNGGFSLFLPPERILGFTKSLPKGAKIKVSFVGQSSLPLDYANLSLNNCSTEKWDKFQTIKLDDGGPAIYKQERIGRFGRPFFIYKYRSMRIDAEKMGPQLSHAGGDDDPRLTKIGKFLRRHHLDERVRQGCSGRFLQQGFA